MLDRILNEFEIESLGTKLITAKPGEQAIAWNAPNAQQLFEETFLENKAENEDAQNTQKVSVKSDAMGSMCIKCQNKQYKTVSCQTPM